MRAVPKTASVHITRNPVLSRVVIRVKGNVFASTTMGPKVTRESPEVQRFVRSAFHVPEPKE